MTKEQATDVLEEILSFLRERIGRGIEDAQFARYDQALEIAYRALRKRRPRRINIEVQP